MQLRISFFFPQNALRNEWENAWFSCAKALHYENCRAPAKYLASELDLHSHESSGFFDTVDFPTFFVETRTFPRIQLRQKLCVARFLWRPASFFVGCKNGWRPFSDLFPSFFRSLLFNADIIRADFRRTLASLHHTLISYPLIFLHFSEGEREDAVT